MSIDVQMPRLSDTMEEGKILKWLKKVGETIEVGDIIAEVETDKADMEMEALDAGILTEIRVQEGESVAVGAVIAVLGEAGETGVAAPVSPKTEAEKPSVVVSPPAQVTPPASERVPVEVASPAPPPPPKVRGLREPRPRREEEEPRVSEERVSASPLVRRMAAEHNLDLRQVRGSGPSGRIVKQDVEALLARPSPSPQRVQAPSSPVPVSAPAPVLAAKKETFSRMRATIAKRLTESMRDAPHFYVTCEIDMSEAVRLRSALKASDRVTADVTYTHVLIKAVAIALEQHPRLNASYIEEGREYKAEINIGLAVALDDGLIVPVLHNCNKLSLLEIAAQAQALVERARTGKPSRDDLSGGTFTISNMGMLPIEHFTAIINPPQGAILATGAIKERPVVRHGQVSIAHTMLVTLSCDHRILDGVTGGQFLATLKTLLENPVGLMV